MVQKVIPPKPRPAAAPDELAVLFPDQTLTIGGARITVREFRHLEGLQVLAAARPLLDDLFAAIESEDAAATPGRALTDAIQRHAQLWVELEARACDRDVAWVAGLRQADAARLDTAFWKANGFFLTNPRLLAAAFDYLLARASRSGNSSSSSSPSGSDATTATSPGASPGASSGISGS
jgi:hypothetical protein